MSGARPEDAEGRKPDPPFLEAVVQPIVEVARPDRIILFGSAARGDAGPDSDLLVVKSGVPHRRPRGADLSEPLRAPGARGRPGGHT